MINDKSPNLSDQQITEYWQKGHLTVVGVFGTQTIYNAIQDIEEWSRQFLSQLDDDKKNYFLEKKQNEKAAPYLKEHARSVSQET